jgi:hypothetical protein
MHGLILLSGLPIAVVLLCIPGALIAFLRYPHEFLHCIPALRIGGIAVLLYFAGSALGTTLVAADGQRHLLRISIIASVVGIPACLLGSILTHRAWGNGAVGAMASDVLLEALIIVLYLRALPAGTFQRESCLLLGRHMAAALPMVLLLVSASRVSVGIWAVLPALAVYLSGCWLLGAISTNDLRTIRNSLLRKARPPSPLGA